MGMTLEEAPAPLQRTNFCRFASPVFQCVHCRKLGPDWGVRAGSENGENADPDDEEWPGYVKASLFLGGIVAFLIVCAGIALLLFYKRKRKSLAVNGAATGGGEAGSWAGERVGGHEHTLDWTDSGANRKVFTVDGKVWDGKLIIGPGPTPEVIISPDSPSIQDNEGKIVSDWEPIVLLGVSGHVTPARRRSVSLRGDEDAEGDNEGRSPSPDSSETQERKKSVTFNNLVEEVQIMHHH